MKKGSFFIQNRAFFYSRDICLLTPLTVCLSSYLPYPSYLPPPTYRTHPTYLTTQLTYLHILTSLSWNPSYDLQPLLLLPNHSATRAGRRPEFTII